MAIIKRENDPDDDEEDQDRIDRLMQEGKEHRNDKEYWKSKYGLDIDEIEEGSEDVVEKVREVEMEKVVEMDVEAGDEVEKGGENMRKGKVKGWRRQRRRLR